jgi:thymidylate synthase ThyX
MVRDTLEPWLIAKGVDKFTARKQARGAARGYLGNALQTEMVWTVNVRAFKGILKQRASAAADAEIRILANRLYECALPYWPAYLGHLKQRPCPDGLGYELYDPNGLKEKHRVLVEAVRGLVASPLGLVGETAAAAAFNDKLANLLKLAS